MSNIIDTLISDARVWQASQHKQTTAPAESTGFALLDDHLPGQGWPRGALIECMPEALGIGELQLMLPTIKRLTCTQQAVFWIDPPHIPYAPALSRAGVDLTRIIQVSTQSRQDHLWTLENCLRSSATGLVIAWPNQLKRSDIRRIQLAAESGDSLCILFRDARHADNSSPAALRLKLAASDSQHIQTDILKRRGGWPVQALKIPITPVVNIPNTTTAQVIQGPWPEQRH
ncbi:translesion DNA synthesis-associated protein ImuA [Marinobacter sp. 1Y8]